MLAWINAHAEGIIRTVIHASLMAGSIYISMHPELAGYAPVLQYVGNAIDASK